MKVTLAARPPLSASPQSLGFGSLELKSWLLELPNSIISLSFDHPTRILGVKKKNRQSSSPRADRLVPVMKATQ